jgi:GNAT superfamily N-acetyltransferase
VSVVERIRDAEPDEIWALNALQRRSSPARDPAPGRLTRDAAELPADAIREHRVRVAVARTDREVGFSAVLPIRGRVCELDALFVDPDFARRGVGRLLVADVIKRARHQDATRIEVIADPSAEGFYARMGFRPAGQVTTRRGPAARMGIEL